MDEQLLRRETETFLGQPLDGLELTKLAGDASTRNFYRLRCASSRSLVLMELGRPNPQEQADLLAVWKYFNTHNLAVPGLYHANAELGWLWFEDLGDLTLQSAISEGNKAQTYAYYRQAVDLLIKIQAAGAGTPDSTCPAFTRAFDVEKLSWELDFFFQHMLEGYLGLDIPAADKTRLQNFFLQISRYLAEQPRYLTHRDYHSRNLMVMGEKLRLVDYQDARLGPCQYDLASLLKDSYVALDEPMVDDLLDYYIRSKEAWENTAIDRGKFREVFDYTCIQRNLKAVGTFAYQHCVRGNSGYLPCIPRTLGYVANNLSKYPALEPFRQLLGKYLPQVLDSSNQITG